MSAWSDTADELLLQPCGVPRVRGRDAQELTVDAIDEGDHGHLVRLRLLQVGFDLGPLEVLERRLHDAVRLLANRLGELVLGLGCGFVGRTDRLGRCWHVSFPSVG